ncbi:Arm DNA-binding domain-containing protein [Phocoenobacter skyensis]|uniref:Integrase n=1 Tax=Phocoenobacter skyensis TaxID=97481 RepID=A0A1H7VAW0_9PAST|nr:tyrosine-type recombinase/integrase [Pasteurella skyensis]QLB23362.1 integrase [Pasteurella skyensis]SEM06035.1 integrase [Pasteurella skyensis]
MGKTKQMPSGVTIRKHKTTETINISFSYKGIRCREPLNIPVNQSNIKYAGRLVGEILNKIERNTFNYADYFPNSRKLKLFGKMVEGVTVIVYLDEYLETCKSRKLSPSTIDGYLKIKGQLKHFHNVAVSQLTPAMIKNWIKQQETKTKTIRNRLSFLKSALDEAVTDGVITINPVSLVTVARYKSTETDSNKKDYIVDPFSPTEINAILESCKYEQWRNLFQFAFRTGLRSSELCALRWIDIDFEDKTAHVQTAKVTKGVVKGTKTKSGNRIVELDDVAISAVKDQLSFTKDSDFVFNDPKTKKGWQNADAIRKKAWVPTLKKSEVRYRNPYQTRHTFATRHISLGANLFWLSKQMGHKGPEMLLRVYGSFLKEYEALKN